MRKQLFETSYLDSYGTYGRKQPASSLLVRLTPVPSNCLVLHLRNARGQSKCKSS